jgi:hypothetical protein
MRSVPASPGLTVAPRAWRRLLAGLGVLAAALAIALSARVATVSDTVGVRAPARAGTITAGGLIGGVPLQQARCLQWAAAGPAERTRVLGALGFVVGQPVRGSDIKGARGTTLGAGQATALFDRACAHSYAQNFLLYEVYIRAAAFRRYLPR